MTLIAAYSSLCEKSSVQDSIFADITALTRQRLNICWHSLNSPSVILLDLWLLLYCKSTCAFNIPHLAGREVVLLWLSDDRGDFPLHIPLYRIYVRGVDVECDQLSQLVEVSVSRFSYFR